MEERKVYEVDYLKRRVKVVLDENKTSDVLLEADDIETLSIDEIIEAQLPVGIRIVESRAPHHLLDCGDPFAGTIGWHGTAGIGSGIVLLPDDFMRLVSFKMSDWSYAVTEVITEDMPEYKLQKSRCAGIRGTADHPVVALVHRPAGLSLEFYSCKDSNVTLSRARYLPIPKITNDGIALSEKLEDAAVYWTGYLVSLTLGQEQLASALLSTAKTLLGE